MTTNLITLALGLIASVSYGLADFFGARASKHLGPITSAFCMQMVGTILFGMWYAVSYHTVPHLSADAWAYTAASAALIAGGVCALYAAFEIGPVSMASPLSAAYPLIAAIVGVLFFHARLSGWQEVGMVLLVFGIMAASGLFKVRRSDRGLSAGPRFALLATLLWGIGYPLLGQAIEQAGWQVVTLVQAILMMATMAGVLALRRRAESVEVPAIVQSLRDPFILGAGTMQMAAALAINYGFTFDQAAGAVVVAISSTYPVLTMVLAFRQFKERLEIWLLAGAGATIAGVALLLV